MTLAQSKINLVQKVLQTEDKRILKAIKLMFDKEEGDNDFELSPDQKKELDKRLTDHKNGKLRYYTIDEVKKVVFKTAKK